MKITILKNGYKMDDAYKVLMSKGQGMTIEHMDTIFYPYLLIEYDVKYEMQRLHKYNGKALCLADMYGGEYSIAKSKGEYLEMDVMDAMVMPMKMEEEHAIKEAPSYIISEVVRGKRVVHTPDIIYVDHRAIYKAFYIVQCRNEDDEIFHIMFDSVAGTFSLLNS